jgi:hypothetical protein
MWMGILKDLAEKYIPSKSYFALKTDLRFAIDIDIVFSEEENVQFSTFS